MKQKSDEKAQSAKTESDESSDKSLIELKKSPLASIAAPLAKISAFGGWPVLVAFLFAPESGFSGQNLPAIYLAMALLVGLSAAALRAWSLGYIRKNVFVVSGPYRYVRNPVELSCLIGYSAGAIFLALPYWYTLSVLAGAWLYMSLLAFHYESGNLQRHGWNYLRYKQRVSRWIPSSLPAANPGAGDFSIARAMFSDGKGWTWFVLLLVVAALRTQFL